MLRNELVAALNARRSNDVMVVVPLFTGGTVRVGIDAVRYDELTDSIVVVTEEYYDGPDPEVGAS